MGIIRQYASHDDSMHRVGRRRSQQKHVFLDFGCCRVSCLPYSFIFLYVVLFVFCRNHFTAFMYERGWVAVETALVRYFFLNQLYTCDIWSVTSFVTYGTHGYTLDWPGLTERHDKAQRGREHQEPTTLPPHACPGE